MGFFCYKVNNVTKLYKVTHNKNKIDTKSNNINKKLENEQTFCYNGKY